MGIALRSLSRGYIPDKAFIIVSFAVTAVFLIGWRSALAAITPEVLPTPHSCRSLCDGLHQSMSIENTAVLSCAWNNQICGKGVRGLTRAGGDEPLGSCSGEKKARQAGQPFGVLTASYISNETVVVKWHFVKDYLNIVALYISNIFRRRFKSPNFYAEQ